MAYTKAKEAIVKIALPSVLNASLQDEQALRTAFEGELAGILHEQTGGLAWNVGKVATQIVVVRGTGGKRAKKAAKKKTAKKYKGK